MEPRNYESGASESAPLAPETPSVGYPTAGNPGTGTPATKPGPFWFHQVAESLRNVITFSGLTPNAADLTLLRQAIKLIGKPIKSYLFGTNGYVVFDGGNNPDFIVQWGLVNGVAANASVTVSYPIAFPNNYFNAVAFYRGATNSSNAEGREAIGAGSSLTEVTVWNISSAIRSISYIAIGS